MPSARILVTDDDPNLREVVAYALARQGYHIVEASDGVEALHLLRNGAFDLVVLDVLMPELDGLETCRQLRQFSQVPVIFLSSRDEELDRVLGLELGGDDYITKPFSPRELVSRVKAVLRRMQRVPAPESPTVRTVGRIQIDVLGHHVHVDSTRVPLTATEFRILLALAQHPGRVYTRDELIERAYSDVRHVSARTLDSHVRHVRAKLREVDADYLETVHGVGFRLANP